MRQFIITLLAILIVSNCFAQSTSSSYYNKRNYYESREFAWDCFHVVTSSLGTVYLNHIFQLKWYESALIMFTMGVMWETLDELYQDDVIKGRQYYGFLDKNKGFDYRDLVRNSVGISISFPIRLKIK